MSQNAQNVVFVNWSNEEFTHSWANEPFTFYPGKKTILPKYLADHFAKHLTDREMHKAVDDKGRAMHTDSPDRAKFLARCFAESSLTASTPIKAQIEALNAQAEIEHEKKEVRSFCDSCDSKGVKHKKDCPKSKPVVTDEHEFAGLSK